MNKLTTLDKMTVASNRNMPGEEIRSLHAEMTRICHLYSGAMQMASTQLNILSEEFSAAYDHSPIHHLECRVKKLDSIIEKLIRRGYEVTPDNFHKIQDIAGVRVICSYVDDIYYLRDLLIGPRGFELIREPHLGPYMASGVPRNTAASRRSWRINQLAPRVEVYMLFYMDTMQAKAMKLMASKLAVAGIIEGTFSEEGLAAMSDVRDMTSQMAKELAQGIRDNVEDIAAAFKKMAIINPNRKQKVVELRQTATPALEQETAAVSQGFGVRSAESIERQNLYDGLLARTQEEQKKRRSKKAVVDENQLSIFDFVA